MTAIAIWGPFLVVSLAAGALTHRAFVRGTSWKTWFILSVATLVVGLFLAVSLLLTTGNPQG